jgi:hypothetical protein
MSALGQANAFLGNVARLGLLGLVAAAGWLGWKVWRADEEHARELAALSARLEQKQKEIERLELSLRLMKVDKRVARVVVLDQTPAAPGRRATTRIRFEEVDGAGNAIGTPRELTIDGDEFYVDSLVAKFEDAFVEQGDALRGFSLLAFRRLFGEHQAPSDGVVLDPPGARPAAYGGAAGMSELEKEIWSRFWDIANDPALAGRFGVRAAHGQAVSGKLKKGAVYSIVQRSSGDLSILPDRSASGSN